jgi:predicted 3-demethylubiquinone-9 3-methyltransferase (glyoxalase superfamily)
MTKIAPCLWFDGKAEEAAAHYARIFPDTRIDKVLRAPTDLPGLKKGEALTVELTILGSPFVGLNGGPQFKFNEAVSFQVYTDTQEETDRYWNALVDDGGEESQCGWCKDKYGLSWQIIPRVLLQVFAAGGAGGQRATQAMLGMRRIDIAAIEAAFAGGDAAASNPT